MPPHSGGGASAPFAHAETLRQTFGAVTPLSQPSADSSPQGEPPLSGDAPSKPLLEGRSEGSALLHAGVLWEPQPVPDAAAGDSLFLRRKIFVVDAGWMHLGYNYGVW